MLSPSSINCFFMCPRLYYYKYILKLKDKPSIHLYRGSLIHSIIENTFKATKYDRKLVEKLPDKIANKWNPENEIQITPDESEKYLNETIQMAVNFFNKFNEKIEMALFEDKINSRNHAWNLLKPRMSEHRIILEDEQVQGIIDSIQEGFSKKVFIIDYKTSKIYKNIVSEEYIRQVRIYAYLYFKENNRLPDFVGLNYLRYGEIYYFPVTDEMIKQAEADIDFVREKTKTTNMEDYPKSNHIWANYEFFEAQIPKVDLTLK